MNNVQINSKLIENGDIFVAINCKNVEQHINEAISRGSSLVFAENSTNPNVIKVPDARLLASKLAKFRFPRQPSSCVAITGTNGKSSTAHFFNQIVSATGRKSANLGTLGLFVGSQKIESNEDIVVPNLTTPDQVNLHKILEYLESNGVEYFSFEASSHALDQKRLHSVSLKAAAFTNLAADHLDYHTNHNDYLKAKMRLFEEILPQNGIAIVSKDFPDLYEKVSKVRNNIITFGISEENDIRAFNIEESENGIKFDLKAFDRTYENLNVKLIGNFQIMNLLCAISLAYALNIPLDEIVDSLHAISSLDGRMEFIRDYNSGKVFVDFAHTSDGLQNALLSFKKICKGRIITVFGCGGDRDQSKRPEMGKIAHRYSDVVIITDDNPRTEDPESIRNSIAEHCPNALNIGNRAEAIKTAMNLMHPHDLVIIFGKGHETYQIYGTTRNHFSDKEIVLEI